ncbi:MAG: hypothetical protein U1E87_08745 [Alphaproteobacteria bacterium]
MDEARRAWPFRWLGLFAAVAIAVAVSVVTLLLPDMYTSTADVAILQSGGQATTPVHNAEIRFIDDESLDAALNEVDLGMNLSTPSARQHARDRLRARISTSGVDTELFQIHCRDAKPARAKAVCDVMLRKFKEAIAKNTDTGVLGQQLVELQQLLSSAEKRLQEYRVAHLDIFGGGGIDTRLDAARTAEEKAASDYESAVKRRDEYQRLWRASRTDPTQAASAGLSAPNGDPLIDRLYSAYTELENLRSRYSENHPDVILLRRQIEAIVRQYPPDVRMCTRGDKTSGAESSEIANSDEAPAIDRPTVDAAAANISVCRALATLTAAEGDVDNLTALNASAPPIQAELNRLTAERDAARDRVDTMRRRIQELDVGDPANLYSVVSAPEIPRAPSSPNRPLWLAGALLAALAGGGLGAYGRGVLASTFVSPAEVRRVYALPFYGAVSQVGGLRSQVGQGAQLITFLGALGALIGIMLVLILADPYITIARRWVVGGASVFLQTLGFSP